MGSLWPILFCFACFVTGVLIAPDASSQAYVGGGIGRSNATGPTMLFIGEGTRCLEDSSSRSYDARMRARHPADSTVRGACGGALAPSAYLACARAAGGTG